MKKIKYFFLILLLLQLSCVKDSTVSDFAELNDITIEGFEKRYDIELGGTLQIKPVITSRENDESRLSYLWYRYNISQKVADTISREKDLNIVVNDVLPGVETMIGLKVTDKKTGIFSRKLTSFYTSGVYSNGTMMLCKTGNDYDLSFLRSSTGLLYENIYSNANNSEKLGAKSTGIFLINAYSRNTLAHKAVIVTANDNSGGVYLEPTTLVRKDYMRDKFMLSEFPGDINITAYASDQGNEYLIVNGKLHDRVFDYSGEKASWQSEISILSAPYEYSLSNGIAQPFGRPFYGAPVVFDNLNGRLMYRNGSGGYFSFFSASIVTGSKFNPSDMRGLEMIVSGSSNSDIEDIWALMKDKETNEYVMITYKFEYVGRTYTLNTLSKTVISRDNCPNLYKGKDIITGTSHLITSINPWNGTTKGITGTFFFSNNDKVYAFNVSTLSEGMVADLAAENCTITAIKCQQIPEPTEANPNANYVRIGVAVKDNKATTKPAGLFFYRLSNIGGISATKFYSKIGIADEIIAFEEKLD